MAKTRATRKLGFEGLEGRAMLAGNVAASVSDGVLAITGDSADNRLVIRQLDPVGPTDPWPGARYEISDLYPAGKPKTTINGQDSVIVEGVKNGMRINLGAGDDYLNISRPGASANAANVPGKLVVDMVGGNDELRLYVNNQQQVISRLGIGNDTASVVGNVKNLSVTADGTWAGAPPGFDRISLANLTATGSTTVDTGGANDDVTIAGVTFAGPLSVNTGNGDDSVRAWMTTTNSTAEVSINTENGDDSIVFGDGNYLSQLNSTLRIDTGLGNDGLLFQYSNSGSVTINTGKGIDVARVHDVTVDALFVWLGEDDDSLYLNGNVKSSQTTLRGYVGTDTLSQKDDSGTDLGEVDISGFEIIV